MTYQKLVRELRDRVAKRGRIAPRHYIIQAIDTATETQLHYRETRGRPAAFARAHEALYDAAAGEGGLDTIRWRDMYDALCAWFKAEPAGADNVEFVARAGSTFLIITRRPV